MRFAMHSVAASTDVLLLLKPSPSIRLRMRILGPQGGFVLANTV